MSTLDVHEAAALAKCHPDTMRKLMKAGEAPGAKIGRAWVVREECIFDWLHGLKLKKAREVKTPRRTLRWGMECISSFMHNRPAPPRPSPEPETHREALQRALPSWADVDAIRAIYRQAAAVSLATGIPHSVDHIVPLRGADVCGLHVEFNLRIITRSENSAKCNRLIEELV